MAKNKKEKSTKEAKFFCESCGSEVPRQARLCPTCGKFFASVRCPKCGKFGTTDDFKNGCPECGYAVLPQSKMENISSIPEEISRKSGFKLFNFGKASYASKTKASDSEAALPFWIYASSITVLIFLVGLLYSCL